MVFSRELSDNEVQILNRMEDFARQAHKHSESHDYAHVLSVCRYAIEIAKNISDEVDPFNVIAAALLHDIGKNK